MTDSFPHIPVLDSDTWVRVTAKRVVSAVVRVVRDVQAGQEALWESRVRLENDSISPPDDRYLHWEPTTAGWRLYGEYLPPDR